MKSTSFVLKNEENLASYFFVDMWTERFRFFAQVWVCHNAREFKRFPVEKTWRKPFSSAFAQ